MRVVLFTDNLGSGGAQRQLSLLARLMKQRGVDVSVATYNDGGGEGHFFLPQLQEMRIPHLPLPPTSYIGRVFALRRLMLDHRPDAIIAFLEGASLYAELSGLPKRTWRIVVSERNAVPNSEHSLKGKLRHFHRLADAVTTNSKSNRDMIVRTVPSLASKTRVIYNAVDLDYFHPADGGIAGAGTLRASVLARHGRQKNLINLLRALDWLKRNRSGLRLRVDWHGWGTQNSASFEEGKRYIQENALEAWIELHPPIRDAREAYWSSDVVLLPSLYEGCPNTVCEGMACGKPVLASNICDNAKLIKPGVNGLLFDPHSPESIAEALHQFCLLTVEERISMGEKSREMAESLFNPDRFVGRYLELLSGINNCQE